jgi:hypothetical protein
MLPNTYTIAILVLVVVLGVLARISIIFQWIYSSSFWFVSNAQWPKGGEFAFCDCATASRDKTKSETPWSLFFESFFHDYAVASHQGNVRQDKQWLRWVPIVTSINKMPSRFLFELRRRHATISQPQ